MQASSYEQAPSGSGSGSGSGSEPNELDDAVCIDPFAPRKIPHYEYKMPSSSSTASSNSDLSDEGQERHHFSYQTAPVLSPMQSPCLKAGSDSEKRYYTGSSSEQDINQVRFSTDFLRESMLNGNENWFDPRNQEQSSKARKQRTSVDLERGSEIDEAIIEETRLCLRGLRRTLDKGRDHASSESVYEWNCRVEQFLEGNLDHAVRVNTAIKKRKR